MVLKVDVWEVIGSIRDVSHETYKMLRFPFGRLSRGDRGPGTQKGAWSSNPRERESAGSPFGNEGRLFGSEGYFIGCLCANGLSTCVDNDAICRT